MTKGSSSKPGLLYLTRTGLLEPLGQSQVFAYLVELARDYDITVVTFDKERDLADEEVVSRLRRRCDEVGIRWVCRRFRRRPPGLAPAMSMLWMLLFALRESSSGRADILHGRSYLASFVAMAAGSATRTPFIFDMRALWIDELVASKRIRKGSLLHRGLLEAERLAVRHADGVVVLTHAVLPYLRDAHQRSEDRLAPVVIPTCTDLARFKVPLNDGAGASRVYGCVGTVLSGWFDMERLAATFIEIARRDAAARFEVVTRDDAAEVRARIGGPPDLQERLAVYASAPQQMPEVIAGHSASLFFYREGRAQLARSPTRLGEVLACGVPVVTGGAVGDVARIVRSRRVGVLLEDAEPASVAGAVDELEQLLSEPGLRGRCREVAASEYSLEVGAERYRRLYGAVLGRPDARATTAERTS